METEYQEMKAWQLCQKLSSGEWKEAIDDDGDRYKLDKYGNIVYLDERGDWLLSGLSCKCTLGVKEYVEPVVYDLTVGQAIDAWMAGENIEREDKYVLYSCWPRGMATITVKLPEEARAKKWRVVEKGVGGL